MTRYIPRTLINLLSSYMKTLAFPLRFWPFLRALQRSPQFLRITTLRICNYNPRALYPFHRPCFFRPLCSSYRITRTHNADDSRLSSRLFDTNDTRILFFMLYLDTLLRPCNRPAEQPGECCYLLFAFDLVLPGRMFPRRSYMPYGSRLRGLYWGNKNSIVTLWDGSLGLGNAIGIDLDELWSLLFRITTFVLKPKICLTASISMQDLWWPKDRDPLIKTLALGSAEHPVQQLFLFHFSGAGSLE